MYDFLEEAKRPDSLIRESIDVYIKDFMNKLKNSEEMQSKINTLLVGFANKTEVKDYISEIWTEIKDSITTDLAKQKDSAIRKSMTNMIQSFGKGIQQDPIMIDKINNFIKNDLLSLLLNNKKMIGDVIASTVKNWDTSEVSTKLELEIGHDLQYIRINGTLVGGLVGLIIYGMEWFYLEHFINTFK